MLLNYCSFPKVFVHVIMIAFLGAGPWAAAAAPQVQTAQLKSQDDLAKATTKAKKELEADAENADLLCRLARLMLKGGDYAARQHLDKALELNPRHLDSLLALSELHRLTYAYEEGERVLQRAAKIDPGHLALRLQQAQYAMDRVDFGDARRIYQFLTRDYPNSAESHFGLANALFQLESLAEAEKYNDQCLALDSEYAPAYTLRASILRKRQETAAARRATQKARELDPLADSLQVKAEDYLKGKFEYEQELRVKKMLEKGDKYLLDGKYKKADKQFSKVIEIHPLNVTAMIGRGNAHYHQQKYQEALRWFFLALEVNPDYYLAQYGRRYTLKRMRSDYNVKYDALELAFDKMDTPEWPYLRDVFINYDQVDKDLQKIVRHSVTPLSNYLKSLKMAGATFYLLPMHQFLWQSPHNARLKGTYTFDLRLWDNVPGIGGFHAVSSAEWERDVIYLGYNVLTHEFTHQVHRFFSKEQNEEVDRLFLKAKEEKLALDYYADYNVMEYLAQGVEAYISEEKPPGQGGTSGHTRQELLEKDPDLYYFIEGLNQREDYSENEIEAYVEKGSRVMGEGKLEQAIEVYEEGVKRYGSSPELLNAMGRAYRQLGDEANSMRLHEQAIREFPEEVASHLELADDYFYLKRDNRKAIELLTAVEEVHADSERLFTKLAAQHNYEGNLDEREHYLQRAMELDPYSASTHYNLAEIHLAKEDYAAAEKYIQSGQKISKNNAGALANLAYICLKTDRREKGLEHLELAEKLSPRNTEVKQARAVFLLDEGKVQEVRELLESLLEENPRRLELQLQLAEFLTNDEAEQAEKLFVEGLKLASSTEAIEFNYQERRFRPQGVYENAVISQLHTGYGILLERQGKRQEAVTHHQEALRLLKDNYRSAVSLIRLYHEAGEIADARQALEALEKLQPPAHHLEEGREILKDERFHPGV